MDSARLFPPTTLKPTIRALRIPADGSSPLQVVHLERDHWMASAIHALHPNNQVQICFIRSFFAFDSHISLVVEILGQCSMRNVK